MTAITAEQPRPRTTPLSLGPSRASSPAAGITGIPATDDSAGPEHGVREGAANNASGSLAVRPGRVRHARDQRLARVTQPSPRQLPPMPGTSQCLRFGDLRGWPFAVSSSNARVLTSTREWSHRELSATARLRPSLTQVSVVQYELGAAHGSGTLV